MISGSVLKAKKDYSRIGDVDVKEDDALVRVLA